MPQSRSRECAFSPGTRSFHLDVHLPKLASGPFRPRNEMKDKRLSTLGGKMSLLPSRCSNQSLTGEPDTSFPIEFRSVPCSTSKEHFAGRLRWTSNREKLPFAESKRGAQEH